MTRTVPSLFLALLVAVATLGSPAQAQIKRAGDTGYLKFGGGFSHYGAPLSDALSFAYVGEIGYQTTSNFGIGLAYQAGRYPELATPDNDRFTTQLLGRYTFGAKTWTVAPYLDAGGSLSFTGTEIGGGPTVGAGLDIVLNDFASFYIESRTNLTFPEEAMDNADSGAPFDELSYAGIGFKLNFNLAPTTPMVRSIDGPTDVQTGESVTYSAQVNDDATRPLEYQWDFGDGSTSSGLTGSHTFSQPGTYTVTFTASNRAGEASESITVNATRPPQPASIASINANPNPVDEGETVRFSSNVQGDSPLSYSWSFGDGASASGSSPTHTYEEPGEYTVRLEASNNAGSDSRTLTMRVNRVLPEICRSISELNSAYFESNSSTLTDEAETTLTENVNVLSKCPNLDVRIEGFAAPGERNVQSLSEDRAQAVAEYYQENGIGQGRITTSGEGQVEGVTTKKGGTRQYRRADSIPVRNGGDM